MISELFRILFPKKERSKCHLILARNHFARPFNESDSVDEIVERLSLNPEVDYTFEISDEPGFRSVIQGEVFTDD